MTFRRIGRRLAGRKEHQRKSQDLQEMAISPPHAGALSGSAKQAQLQQSACDDQDKPEAYFYTVENITGSRLTSLQQLY